MRRPNTFEPLLGALSFLAVRRERDDALPRARSARKILLSEGQHDALIEQCLQVLRIHRERVLELGECAVGLGAGAEARRPMGLAVVGGLVVSQLLTLFITPVFYTYMEQLRGLFKRSRPRVEKHTGLEASEEVALKR